MAVRKGDLLAIEVRWRTVALSGIAGKAGHVYTRISWHIVKAHQCTKERKMRVAIDAAGDLFKMCERLKEVGRIVPIPDVDAEACFEASRGLTWESPGEVADFARGFLVPALPIESSESGGARTPSS